MNSIPLTHQQAADPRLRSRLEAQGFAIIADTTNSTYHAVRVFSAEAFAAENLSQSAESKPTEVKVVQERREKFNSIFHFRNRGGYFSHSIWQCHFRICLR